MKIFGMPVIVDDSLPAGEIRLTDWRSYIRIVNVGEVKNMGMKIVRISSHMLQEMLTEGWQAGGEHEIVRCIEGLPPDAEFVGTTYVPAAEGQLPHELRLVFSHPDWPILTTPRAPEAMLNITWQRIDIS